MVEILVFLVTLVVCFFLCKNDKSPFAEPPFSFWNILASILLSITVAMFSTAFTSTSVKTKEVSEIKVNSSTEIVALADSSEISGKHFLGSGSIGENDYYVYYVETEHGFKREKSHASSVYLKYIPNNETPHIDKYSHITQKVLVKKPENAWLSLVWYLCYKNTDVGDVLEKTTSSSHTIIYIPEGTIQENYILDLE